MSDAHRIKIGNSNILKNLLKHADGELEMTPSQVQVGLALLKKVMPDLQAITLETGENGFVVQLAKDVRKL